MTGAHDPAAARFFAIQLMRLGGVLATVYAIMVLSGSAPWPDVLPRFVAWILLVIGLADVLLVPRLLARAWSTEAIERRRAQSGRSDG